MNKFLEGKPERTRLAAYLLRPDGSLMADHLQHAHLEILAKLAPPGDPVCAALCMVAHADGARSLIDPAGNVGEKQFHYSRRIVGQALVFLKQTTNGSGAGDEVARGLLALLESINQREAAIRVLEEAINAPYAEDQAQFLVSRLRADCDTILNRSDQKQCIAEFWRLWELAWALYLTKNLDEPVIGLRSIYQHNPWLDRRRGERRRLTPPGGLQDPDARSGADDNIELF
ncbi:MAG: hypothetical protein HQL82_05950 [Magnetococcales bacterium]|nr:hypothetical protein [Magnetococcales bacterium]